MCYHLTASVSYTHLDVYKRQLLHRCKVSKPLVNTKLKGKRFGFATIKHYLCCWPNGSRPIRESCLRSRGEELTDKRHSLRLSVSRNKKRFPDITSGTVFMPRPEWMLSTEIKLYSAAFNRYVVDYRRFPKISFYFFAGKDFRYFRKKQFVAVWP